ncbi:hypothetical protein CEXT_185151 [Caerostris extrusa]|uniref:Uncharacterized protein n=1 Tax=Caerostris extrusa TaxID=172846 RepID=A0AAV4TMU7_CAEEX|nr:hypothetical protein CEXT_185151 [Caerostris extrusa]
MPVRPYQINQINASNARNGHMRSMINASNGPDQIRSMPHQINVMARSHQINASNGHIRSIPVWPHQINASNGHIRSMPTSDQCQ